MIFGPILHGSIHILIDFLMKDIFPFILVVGFSVYIFIFDFDDILFIVVDNAE